MKNDETPRVCRTITVGDLLTILSQYPPDLPVVVDGYEGGQESLAPNYVYPALMEVAYKDWDGDRRLSARGGVPHLVIGRGPPPHAEWCDKDELDAVLPVRHVMEWTAPTGGG